MAFEELKARQSAVWSAGSWEPMAARPGMIERARWKGFHDGDGIREPHEYLLVLSARL